MNLVSMYLMLDIKPNVLKKSCVKKLTSSRIFIRLRRFAFQNGCTYLLIKMLRSNKLQTFGKNLQISFFARLVLKIYMLKVVLQLAFSHSASVFYVVQELFKIEIFLKW